MTALASPTTALAFQGLRTLVDCGAVSCRVRVLPHLQAAYDHGYATLRAGWTGKTFIYVVALKIDRQRAIKILAPHEPRPVLPHLRAV